MRDSPATDADAPYVRLAVVGLVHRAEGDEGRWLLLRRQGGERASEVWDPPGGRLERREDLTEAVQREVREETGLAVEVAGPCYAFLTFYKGERLLAVSMACRPVGISDELRLQPEEVTAWRWSTSEEWQTLAAAGRTSWALTDVQKATRTALTLLRKET
jgi:8-oxo-dGTP pyrophosphatase MutT (NUDIX family)